MNKILIVCGMLLLCSYPLKAQTVTGHVADESTEDGLPGVNVVVKGTTIGTTTDAEGDYELNVPSLSDTLVFSFVGFETLQIPVNNENTINVEMQSQVHTGEGVVVVGYGEQDRSTITGSISAVSADDIDKSPSVNVGNSLAGKVSGLQSTQYSGQPGADAPQLFLRGVGSLATGRSNPLIIVDGVQRDMFQLEPSDIESISILKDASATAVYGIEGANGVIVVKTKRGSGEGIQVSARLSTGIQQPTQHQEYLDSYNHAQMYNEAQRNDGVLEEQLRFSPEAIEAFRTNSHPEIYPSIDWVDYLTKPAALQTKNNISISGGTQNVKYFVSGGYLIQDGLFETFNSSYDFNDSFKKYSFRTNLDIDATSTTRVSITSSGRIESRNRVRTASLGDGSLWQTIYRGAPFSSAGIVDEKFTTQSNYISGGLVNPLNQIYGNGYNHHDNNVLNMDLGIVQHLDFITEGLIFEIKGSYNTNFHQNKYRNSTKANYSPFFRTDVDPSAPGDSSIVYRKTGTDGALTYDENYTNRSRNWYAEARLEYNQDFRKHKVGGLLLYNQRRNFYPSEFRAIPRGLVSSVGRINYNYDNRYLLEVNMGYNGSENFAEGNRFGFFPAVSAGWIVTNENFMKGIGFLDQLKLRASYGVVGNDSGIGRFLYLPDTYTTSAPGYNFGYEISQNTNGAAEEELGNPLVQWETATKQNFGIDLRLLQERFELSIDYFNEYRDNILTTRNTIPAYVAADLPAINFGEVENKGYEVSVNWQDQIGEFAYHINTNLSFARNEILFMDEVPRNEPYLQRTGNPVNQPFGYIFDGFFSESDMESLSEIPEHPYTPQPGDLKFKDLNGDGVINNDDQQAIGYPDYPEYSFGGEIGFRYKNFDLTTVWAGATNVSRLLTASPYRIPFCAGGQCSMMKWMADGRWTPENSEEAVYPRLSIDNSSRLNNMDSDFWMRDASYLRLKNAVIGYNFRSSSLQNIGIRNIRMFINGYNLLTFSKLKIVDPEQTTQPGNATYPIVKIYNFGVNINF